MQNVSSNVNWLYTYLFKKKIKSRVALLDNDVGSESVGFC